ncbi:MAG: hypothetical protein DME15_06035 [Candidatus Rokuibacteriota bacterium]|nr:MAG: hypothetical protein DME15_06035 [Candidatus Rokubacteria bacterium]
MADMAARDVLIVEEDRKLREVLHQVFLSVGYNCLLAGDGHEGLEVFRRSHPALIVSDLNLPVMSGMELRQDVRRCRHEDRDRVPEAGRARLPHETDKRRRAADGRRSSARAPPAHHRASPGPG